VDNKDQYYHEKLVSTIYITHINEKSKTQVDTFSMTMDVDDSHLDLMPHGNKRHNGSNHKTLTGKAINQVAWELVAPTWHDDVYEQSFFFTSSNFH
jgi:hypothetical protein